MTTINTEEGLRALYAEPTARSLGKQLDHLDHHMRRFIELSPFVVLATTGEGGQMDASPRGGAAGFVKVVNERAMLLPDWPGNNRLDSLSNLIAHGEIGLLFLIPGIDETLRVSGRATLRSDEALRDPCREGERLPKLVIEVSVREAFLHCAKALMRSELWSPEARQPRDVLPTMGQMLKDQLGSKEPAESRQAMLARYRSSLY